MATATKPYANINVEDVARPHWLFFLLAYAIGAYVFAIVARVFAEVSFTTGMSNAALVSALHSVHYHIGVLGMVSFSYFLGCILFPGMKYLFNFKGFILPFAVLFAMTVCTGAVYLVLGVKYGIQGVDSTSLLLERVFWAKTIATSAAGFLAANMFHKERYFPGWDAIFAREN